MCRPHTRFVLRGGSDPSLGGMAACQTRWAGGGGGAPPDPGGGRGTLWPPSRRRGFALAGVGALMGWGSCAVRGVAVISWADPRGRGPGCVPRVAPSPSTGRGKILMPKTHQLDPQILHVIFGPKESTKYSCISHSRKITRGGARLGSPRKTEASPRAPDVQGGSEQGWNVALGRGRSAPRRGSLARGAAAAGTWNSAGGYGMRVPSPCLDGSAKAARARTPHLCPPRTPARRGWRGGGHASCAPHERA